MIPTYGRPSLAGKDAALYVQTGWKMFPATLLELGLRADGMSAVEGIYRNVAPLAGFTWDPNRKGQSRIYANWGLFYQYLPLGNITFGKGAIEQRLYRIDNAATTTERRSCRTCFASCGIRGHVRLRSIAGAPDTSG